MCNYIHQTQLQISAKHRRHSNPITTMTNQQSPWKHRFYAVLSCKECETQKLTEILRPRNWECEQEKKVDDLLARMRRNGSTMTWKTILAPTREFLNLISGYGFQACYSHPNPRNWLLITLIEVCIADNLMKYGSGWIMHWCHLQENDCALQHLCWLCPSG